MPRDARQLPPCSCAHPTHLSPPSPPPQPTQEYIDISEPIDFRSQLEGGAWVDFVIGRKEKDKQGRLGLEEKNKNYQHNRLTAQPPLKFSGVLTVQEGMNGRVHTWTPTPTPALVFNDQIFCRSQEVLLHTSDLHQGSRAQLLSKTSALGSPDHGGGRT